MSSLKFTNIFYSLVIFAGWTGIILFLSGRVKEGIISPLFFWAMLTSYIVGIGALIILAVRIFRLIDRDTNFLYAFLGTTNGVLGLLGTGLYIFHSEDIYVIQESLPHLLIAAVIFCDMFRFGRIFRSGA
jgi:hypothetical protein